jgi:hypothetical protein
MPGVLIDRVADEVTQRNFERVNAALASIMGDPLRYAKGPQGVAIVRYLRQPATDSTAFITPTGVLLPLAAGACAFRFVAFFQSVGVTTGIGFSVVGPPASLVRFGISVHESATVLRNGASEAYESVVLGTAVDTAATIRHAVIEGFVITKNPGDLGLSFQTEVATQTVTVMAGTHGLAWSCE